MPAGPDASPAAFSQTGVESVGTGTSDVGTLPQDGVLRSSSSSTAGRVQSERADRLRGMVAGLRVGLFREVVGRTSGSGTGTEINPVSPPVNEVVESLAWGSRD